jgi:hypothetical protein
MSSKAALKQPIKKTILSRFSVFFQNFTTFAAKSVKKAKNKFNFYSFFVN